MAAKGWTPTLKYSPVNGVIIDWGVDGRPFCVGCLPEPIVKHEEPKEATDCDCPETPVVETVDTYDWFRWTPEIIVGIQDASEDMAASYARRAAIEWSRGARVLQRKIVINLQQGVHSYPLDPFDGESVQGVISVESVYGRCRCESYQAGIDLGVVKVDVPRQELKIVPTRGACGCHVDGNGISSLIVTVWVSPTEDSCRHDVYLYEQFRREITLGARSAFIEEAHSTGSYKTMRGYANARGDALTHRRADAMRAEFVKAMVKAKVKAYEADGFRLSQPVSPFTRANCGGHRR